MMGKNHQHVILSKTIQTANPSKEVLKDTAIILYLYYEDTLQNYYPYFQNIPEETDVYVYSSNHSVCENVQQYIKELGKQNIYVKLKENRGRDVSALLVAAKDLIQRYEYICFVHDKKANEKHLEQDTQKWIELLWENTLASKEFVRNVLNTFETNSDIGLMIPPKPVGKYIFAGLRNCWAKNYENTVALAQKIGLQKEIEKLDPPVALSTVFWTRRKALEKLFAYNWNYDDFPEEPMPVDGTISHAIERILSYVAEDAGYNTAIVLNDEYAEKQISEMQGYMESAFEVLYEEVGITKLLNLENFNEHKSILRKAVTQGKDIYLYGAGYIGSNCIKTLKVLGCEPKGYIVTRKDQKDYIDNLPVYQIDEMAGKDDIFVIVSVGKKYQDEIIETLKKNQIKDYMIWE